MTDLSPKAFDRLDYIYKILVVAALSITAIILASDIIVPLAFAGLISVVMLPVVRRLENRGMNTALAIALVLTLTIVLMVLFTWLALNQIIGLINDLPNLQAKFESYINHLSNMLRDEYSISIADQTKMLNDIARTTSGYVADILIGTTNTLSIIIQVPIYIFLFLIYRDKFKIFFLQLLPKSEDMPWKKEVEKVLQGYISGLFLVTIIIAFLNTVGLLIVGIDHAIFFGILSGVLTIIPYVGIIIGSLFPIVMALITKDSLWYATGVIIVFTIVQFLEGNFITPRITGSKVSINALAAIIALVIGGKILGIAGMILSIPALGITRILLSYSNHLKPFVVLIEDSTPVADTTVISPVLASEDPPVDPTVSQ
jgi:predicted PurR-regulated permease PerM